MSKRLKKGEIPNRRDFLKSLASYSALSSIAPFLSPWTLASRAFALETSPQRLSWLSQRGTTFEGAWTASSVEGAIPAELSGTLYRIGPGSKNTQGTALTHFFDGDGLVTRIQLGGGAVSIRSRFVETTERLQEISAGKMLFDDYGTPSPARPRGYKYSPNIHVLPWQGKLLSLSESSHPTALDPDTLETQGLWDFEGTLPKDVTFTAHPKRDPASGAVYSYGISKSLFPNLKVYRSDATSAKLTELYSIDINGFYPTHDMMMTENHLIFVISPVKINLAKAALTLGTIADSLEYDPSQPLRIIVARKDGSQDPLEISSAPSGLIFHHCNAFEDASTGRLVFYSMLMDDAQAYTLFKNWAAQSLPPAPVSKITRFELDLAQGTVFSRAPISDGTPTDFPCIDARQLGSPLRRLYALESRADARDPLSFDTIAAWDLSQNSAIRVQCDAGQTLGELVYVPAPGTSADDDQAGWLLHLGYDSRRDETFLDIRAPSSLGLIARAWMGRFTPLGFHGAFV
jgi:carotenoid cleavage dioxygenase-like enzyme